MKNKLKTILRIFLLALVALIVGTNVYHINAEKLGGNPVPMPFGFGTAVVLSGSMEPELSVGDLIIIAERESYAVGEVVVFCEGRTAVVHRIVAQDEESFTTRGDANGKDDKPIPKGNVKGEVVLVIPLVGYVVNVVKSPLGTVAVLALAVWLWERSFRMEKENDRRKLEAIREEIRKLKEEQAEQG